MLVLAEANLSQEKAGNLIQLLNKAKALNQLLSQAYLGHQSSWRPVSDLLWKTGELTPTSKTVELKQAAATTK